MKYFLFVSTFFSIMLLTVHMALLPGASVSQSNTCPSAAPDQYSHLEPGKIVAGYFLSWKGREEYTPMHFEKVASKVTHLIYAFAKPNNDGTGDFLHPKIAFGIGDSYAQTGGNFEQLLKVKKKHPHLKILLSVGGGGCDQIFLELARNNLLHKYAETCVKMLDSHTYTFDKEDEPHFGEQKHFSYRNLFDGIDINWEFSPRGVKKEIADAYLSFVQEMRRLLNKRAKRLKKSMTLTATLQVSPRVYGDLAIDQVAESIDWFNVMGYDIYNSSAGSVGHNAPMCGSFSLYTVDGALNRIMNKGVSPNKLVLVLPGYGHQYGETNGFNKPFNRKSKHTKSLPYKEIVNRVAKNQNFQSKWDSLARVPTLLNTKDKITISYDDAHSFRQKVGLAAIKLLLGVGLWALSYVHDETKSEDEHHLIDIMSEFVGLPFIA